MLAAASTAQAGVIVSPTAVLSNSMGNFGDGFDIGNVIDQSGLSAGFTSDADYATYLSTSPTHAVGGSPDEYWVSSTATTTGSIVFDLGADYSVERLAIWQGAYRIRLNSPLATSMESHWKRHQTWPSAVPRR